MELLYIGIGIAIGFSLLLVTTIVLLNNIRKTLSRGEMGFASIEVPPIKIPDQHLTIVTDVLLNQKRDLKEKRFITTRMRSEGEFDFYEIRDENLETVSIIAQSSDGCFIPVIPIYHR